MKSYQVKIRLIARYIVNTTASNPELAKTIAEEMFSEADFGSARDIDGEITSVTEVDDTYQVKMRIIARYVVDVEAKNPEDAKEKAEAEFSDADFGPARDIDGEVVSIADEAGFIFHK